MANEFNPDYVSPPGDTIRECIERRGWTEKDLAHWIGRDVEFAIDLLAGKAQLTLGLANKLGWALGPSTEWWLRRERAYRKGLDKQRQGRLL